MGYGKWIGGFLGWVTMGPIGALLGFWFGSAVDGIIERSGLLTDGGASATNTRTTNRTTYTASEQRNSFLVSLLVLSAAVIKADGKTLHGTRGSLRTMHVAGSAPSCCAFTHRVAFEEVSGPRVLFKSGQGNRGLSACGTTHGASLKFPSEAGFILRCAGKAEDPS